MRMGFNISWNYVYSTDPIIDNRVKALVFSRFLYDTVLKTSLASHFLQRTRVWVSSHVRRSEKTRMSISLPCRYAFFSGATPVRISSLCFAVRTTSHRNTKLFPEPILLRHVTSPRWSNLETARDCRAHASSIGSYEDSSSSSTDDQEAANSNGFDLNSLVSFAEVLCIVSSAVISVVLAANYVAVGEIGRKVLSLGFVGLLGSVASGSWLRRRQWMRICRGTRDYGEGTNLIRRLEKLEDDLKTSTTIVRVLSRHLEKLGIRFRITRKALKEPISEVKAPLTWIRTLV